MKKECSLVIVLILTLFQLVRADESSQLAKNQQKTYSEGVFHITLPATYERAPDGPLLETVKKQFMGQHADLQLSFFRFFAKLTTEGLFIFVLEYQRSGPVDLNMIYGSYVKKFKQDCESGALAKTSRGVSKVTLDGLPSILIDRETAKGSRIIYYYFALPEYPSKFFSFGISARIDTFNAHETELGEIIKSLKIKRSPENSTPTK